MAATREEKIDAAKSDIRALITAGEDDSVIGTYIRYAQSRIEGLEPSEIYNPAQAEVVRNFRRLASFETGPPQPPGAATLGADLATIGMLAATGPGAGAARMAGPRLGRLFQGMISPARGAGAARALATESAAVGGAAGAGSLIGETIGRREEGEGLGPGIGRTIERAGEAALFNAAFRALPEVFRFIRGTPPSPLQKKAKKFATGKKFEGRPVILRPETGAERTIAGRLGRAVQHTKAGQLFAQQQGMKIARFVNDELTKLTGARLFASPSNAVANVAPRLSRFGGANAQKFAGGVGLNFENAGIWLEQFFSPANIKLINKLRKADPRAFEQAKTAWLHSALESRQAKVSGETFPLFEGNAIRTWFEGERKFIRQAFGPQQEQVLDNFTAYLQFASPTAKRAFENTAKLKDLVPEALGVAAATGIGGPGAGLSFFGAVEVAAAGLSVALSRPVPVVGNSIYRLFAQPGPFGATTQRIGRIGAQTGAFRATQDKGDRGGDPRFPLTPPRMPSRAF